MKTVLIAGGTGLIGSRLTELLLEKGYAVNILSRKKIVKNNAGCYLWNPGKNFMEEKAIQNADHIVNLAGAGIADKRWTKKWKEEIISSRVNSSKTLFKALQEKSHPVKSIICASATGYYAKNKDEALTEESKPGSDFLALIVKQWEAVNHEFEKLNLRTVILRFGIVLSLKGGALQEMYKPLQLGIAGYFGKGNQYYSWIHIDDLCGMLIHALENEKINGIYNAVAPSPVTNKNLMKTMTHVKGGYSLLIPIPPFIMKIALGEKASIVLDGQNISSDKIEKSGFNFKYPGLKNALKNLLEK